MDLLFLLKQHVPELAALEAKASARGWRYWESREKIHDGTLLLKNVQTVPSNLGLTHRIIRVIASCTPKDIEKLLSNIDWNATIGKKTYKVELTRYAPRTSTARELATIIWTAQKKPRVAMQHPDLTVDIVMTKARAYVGLRAWESQEKFEERRAHLWPAPHPSAAHPAIARAVAHLACARKIHDPCCGAGGTLIEAGLAGITVSGGDISPEMVDRARKNLAHYKVRARLRVADATKMLPKIPALVTDVPFGISTRGSPTLARALLRRADTATERVILGTPGPLRSHPGWRVRAHVARFVHKGLTRHVYVLERM